MLGKAALKILQAALKSKRITKREFDIASKASSSRISNSNTIQQNIILGKAKSINTSINTSTKQSIKKTSTVGGYVSERQQIAEMKRLGVSDEEIRRKLIKDIQPVFDAANKRIKRLADIESENITLPALKALREDIPTGNFSVKGKDTDELIRLYRTAITFMNHETSTIKGASKHIQQSIKTFGGSAKQATARRKLVDDMLNDKVDMTNANYADFTQWISNNISTIDTFNQSEVEAKVKEIENRKRQLREEAIERAKAELEKPQMSSASLRALLGD